MVIYNSNNAKFQLFSLQFIFFINITSIATLIWPAIYCNKENMVIYKVWVKHFLHTGKGYLIFYPGSEIPCYLTQAVTRGKIGCIGTPAHGRQVTSMFSQTDVIM